MGPADRVASVYFKLSYVSNHDASMQAVWSKIFDVADDEGQITRFLMALQDEVELARSLLLERKVPVELIQTALDGLKSIASPSFLRTNFGSVRGYVTPNEIKTSLQWACWALQDVREDDLDSTERNDLIEDINGIEVRLAESDIAPHAKYFIKRQLDAIRSALQMYPVRGIRPLSEAMEGVMGACALDGQRVFAEAEKAGDEGKGLAAKAAQVIKKTAEVCDQMDKIRKFGEGSVSLAASVGPFLVEAARNLLK